MKKPLAAIAAAMFFLALAAPASAGSSATVTQLGNGGSALVIQKPGKPTRVMTGVNPGQKYFLTQKGAAAAKQAMRPRYAMGGKAGGRSSYCNPYAGPNAAAVAQSGTRNSAGIVQQGANNVAGSIQQGDGNKSLIVQKGNGHFAETIQAGSNNTAIIVQKC
jgi:hypothetical protein